VQSAFTLIELIIVAAIMIIVLLVGVVNYLRFLEKQQLYQVGSDIEAMLKDARNKSQTGFLGNADIGFCNQLKAVEIVSSVNLDSQLVFNARLVCMDDSLIAYDTYVVEQVGIVMNHSMRAAFLPRGGVQLFLDNVSVDQLSAIVNQGDSQISIQIDRGGLISVLY